MSIMTCQHVTAAQNACGTVTIIHRLYVFTVSTADQQESTTLADQQAAELTEVSSERSQAKKVEHHTATAVAALPISDYSPALKG